jgi:alkanesulfonate monooxygenase SsuD/methylene tetrahydromethanopterin reductase-like flavin-dependent oxidoreductase (luciferase family)
MSSSPSSSKTAAVAGTLAGLLVAGLFAYFVYLQKHVDPSEQARQAAAIAGKTPIILAQADTNTAPRSKAQASLALLALPELKAWSDQLEKTSGGKLHGALIEDDPAPRIIKGKRYYQFSFVGDGADAAHRLESFLAAADGDDILVEDDASDELLSLDRWRNEKHPMQRDLTGLGD